MGKLLSIDQILSMRGIHQGLTMREIAKVIRKSVGWVHRVLSQLLRDGYVINVAPGKARQYRLTEKAIRYLEANHFLENPPEPGTKVVSPTRVSLITKE